jgi:AcrR family transcriptional regulator
VVLFHQSQVHFDGLRRLNRHVPHLSREARLERLLMAASDLVTESGINSVTMTAIAERSGVSRQWLHEFFPDVESIYIALYWQYRNDYISDEPATIRSLADLEKLTCTECVALLDLPVASAIILSHALTNFGSESSNSGRPSLREVLMGNLEVRYVQPLVALGYDRDEIIATVLTIVNMSLGLIIAARNGRLEREATAQRMIDVVKAVINDTVRSPRSVEFLVD